MTKRKKQKRLENFIDKLKDGEIDYKPKVDGESGLDWSKYDKAQVNELKDMLKFVKNSVDEAVERSGFDEDSDDTRGRPSYPPEDLAKGVLLQQYFEVSNRVAAGFVDLFSEKLGIEEAYSYKTLERAYDNPEVAMILREVFEMSQEPVEDEETMFSPDGTGIPNSMKDNWEKTAYGDEGSNEFTKMIAMMGATYQFISSVDFPNNPHAHESPYFQSLLEETASNYTQIDLVSGDAAYLSRENCELIRSCGATPRLYPKKGITLKRGGCWAWGEMLFSFMEDPQEWLEEYHSRSNVESGFSNFKRNFLAPLRKCIFRRRKTEAFARACDYNLKRACYVRRQEGMTAPWMFD